MHSTNGDATGQTTGQINDQASTSSMSNTPPPRQEPTTAQPQQPGRWRLSNRTRIRVLIAMPLVAAGLWLGGLLWFIATMPLASPHDPGLPATDAVVVLTGGSNRLQTGIDLLRDGRASKLFITGVYRGVEVDELLRLARNAPEELECCIELDHLAGDTVENAAETVRWMAAQGYQSLRLVTSDYHIRRSLLELAMADPALEVTPHAITPKDQPLHDWWRRPESVRLYAVEYTIFLVPSLRYRLYQWRR